MDAVVRSTQVQVINRGSTARLNVRTVWGQRRPIYSWPAPCFALLTTPWRADALTLHWQRPAYPVANALLNRLTPERGQSQQIP